MSREMMSHKNKKSKGSVRHGVEKVVRSIPGVPGFKKLDDYTWEELEEIEIRRRNILFRVEDDFWEILSQIDGSTIRFLRRDGLFWCTLLIYVLIRCQARFGSVPDFVAELGNGNVSLIGGFISFFLVLYVNKNHSRYFEIYHIAMAAKGRIFDAATLANVYFPKKTGRRLIRYMNACHVAGFVGLSKTYPASTFWNKLNKDFGLLTPKEMARMEEIDMDKGGSCNRELAVWCLQIIDKEAKRQKLDPETTRDFRKQIMELRANFGKLTNEDDLPVPFFYVHFICLLTALYLPLFAVAAAYNAGTGDNIHWTADVVAGLSVILQSIFVNGLRILGQKMSDPWGPDEIDLSVIYYVTFTWKMSNRILESERPDVDEQQEEILRQNMDSVGKAWDEFDPGEKYLHHNNNNGFDGASMNASAMQKSVLSEIVVSV